MKILHVLDHSIPQHSGYAFRTLAIVREQRRRGWETAHVTSTKHPVGVGAQIDYETVDGLGFYRTRRSSSPLRNLGPLAQWGVIEDLARRLDEVVERERPDIVHAHSPALNGIAAARVARRKGLPLVYEIRAFWEDAAVDHGTSREGGVRYRATRALETRAIRAADHVTTICEGLRGEIVARGKPAADVTVIPNAVDIDRFEIIGARDTALAQRLNVDDAPTFGFIGSFYGYEGIEMLVRALRLLRSAHPALKLVLVGGGPEEPRVKALIDQLDLHEHVVLTGRVPHDEVQRYYSLIDVLAYPRLKKRITDLVTPLKPLETMAQGRLVIASDVGGHRELIEDGQTGLMFEAGSVESLADAVERALEDPALRERLRANGRRFVTEERNWAASVARYAPVYEALVRGT